MNRSILIVIVDFLLISLLAFSRFDEPNIEDMKVSQPAALTNPNAAKQDLTDVLKTSLEKERENREQLNEELRAAQAQLQAKEQSLSEREKLMREAGELLQQKATEAARLAQERSQIQEQFVATQADIAKLQSQLTNTASEASMSRQRLDMVQQDLQARAQEEAILQRKLAELEKTRQAAEQEKQQLATQLQIAETETRLMHQQLESTKSEVQVERQEKAKLQEHATKLAEGVSALAEKSGELSKGVSALAEKSGEISKGVSNLTEKSGELTKEIRENRPLAPNAVFSDFVTNRVRGDFRAVRTGVFGREINREKEAKSVLLQQGSQIYAIYHVNDTPLSLSFPGIDWDWLIANLRRGSAVARVDKLMFLAVDPRVILVPISDAKARELGSKVYKVPKEPYKFQEAILVGANEGYYGECKFQMDAENPQYVRMQRERFSWIMGKFAPSSGDLVFTKTGDLLGIMVNKDYCLLLTEFSPAYQIQTGIGIGDQQTGLILSQCYSQVARMPVKLQ